MPHETLTFFRSNGYITASYYCHDGRMTLGTGIPVSKDDWEKHRFEKLKPAQGGRINRMDLIATEYVANCRAIHTPVLKTNLKSELQKLALFLDTKKSAKHVKPSKHTLVSSLIEVLDLINEGELKQKSGKPFSEAVKRHYGALIALLKDSHLRDIPLSNVTTDVFFEIINLMLKNNLAQNTVCCYVVRLKQFFRITHKILKWHTNEIYKNEDLYVAKDDIDYAIYLNHQEIEKLLHLVIPDEHRLVTEFKTGAFQVMRGKTLRRVRDLFVFGTQVALRHCDLFQVTQEKMQNWVINMNTQKTGEVVYVPMSSIARDIWQRYDGNLPKFQTCPFNNGIREICRMAGFDELVLFSRMQGGERMEEYLPKWKLAASHSMRRSFATNAYLAGVPDRKIMLITGHKTSESFRKYIRIQKKENAEDLKKHSFFR